MTNECDKLKEYVEERLRPRVQSDGGEIRFLSYENGTLAVEILGECAACPGCGRLQDFIIDDIAKRFGMHVRLKPVVIKPYFRD